MVCKHLRPLEEELHTREIGETYRGQAWSENCREWVYFACKLDLESLRARFGFGASIKDHMHRGTHDGAEAGFVCTQCNDAIMGAHPEVAPENWPIVR